MSPRTDAGGSRHSGMAQEPTARQRRVLSALVQAYIDQGEPVSSLWLVDRGRFDLSSATVRNVMVRLEEMGYLRQPHTSAGRVPTDLGYRCYVDDLLAGRRPARPARAVEARLRRSSTVEDVLTDVSRELSRASHHVGFALSARVDSTTFKHIEFVPLDANRLLVVVVATGGRVLHKLVEVPEAMRPVDLQQAANYLNTEFTGRALAAVRQAIVARLQQERVLYDALTARALQLAHLGVEELGRQDVLCIQGASWLLEDLREIEVSSAFETLRALLAMMEEKHRLITLLNQYIEGPGLLVVIGSEHADPDLQSFSLIASTYADAERSGTVGIIGPTRMRYSQAIDVVQGVSRVMSRVLDDA